MKTSRAVASSLAVGAVPLLLFDRILLRGEVLFERDIHCLVYPQAETLVRCLATGSWPLWNPYVGFGQPLLANPGAQVLYPWTWLNLLFAPGPAYAAYVVGHLVLSGVGLRALAGRLGISAAGSTLAAALWMASGPLLSLVNLWQHFAGAAWIPWVLLAADGALRHGGLRRALVWGAAAAGQVLAGSVELCLLTALLTPGLALRYLVGPARDLRRVVSAAAVASATAAALSAALWLPAADVLARSDRTGLTPAMRAYWSLHPVGLLQAVVPVLARDLPLRAEHRAGLFEGREPFLNSIYLGVTTLPFVGAGLAHRRRRRLAGGLLILMSGAAVLALGRYGGAYSLLVQAVPPLGVFRYPAKAVILVALAWALLAGLGFDAWREAGERWRSAGSWRIAGGTALCLGLVALGIVAAADPDRLAVLFVTEDPWGNRFPDAVSQSGLHLLLAGGFGLAAHALAWLGRDARPVPWSPGRTAAVAALLAVADLVAANRPMNPTAREELVFERPEILRPLQTGPTTRVYSFDYQTKVPGKTYRRPDPLRPVPARHASLPPLLRTTLAGRAALVAPTAQTWGIYGSYDWDVLSLNPASLRRLIMTSRAAEETVEFRRLLQVGAVSYVIAHHTEGLEGLPVVAALGNAIEGRTLAFAVPDPLPRAYAVGGVRVADGVPGVAALIDPGFDPEGEVVLPEGAVSPPPPGFRGRVRFEWLTPDRARVVADLSHPGHVVMVDAFDPGWRASVDGVEAPVLRANVAFRAVAVPAGQHVVDLVYRPPAVARGLLASAGALAGALALAWLTRRRETA